MAHVTIEEVQQWLQVTKLALTAVDDELEATASTFLLSALAQRYDVSGWTDDESTPDIVRKAMAMLIASYEYRRAYAENIVEEGNSYADWLEGRAQAVLEQMLAGNIDIPGVDPTLPGSAAGSFWPNDMTGSTQQYDAAGNAIGGQFDADRKFNMGAKF